MTENEINYYTVREVSKIMRKSRSVIYDWICQGKIPHFKLPNSNLISSPKSHLKTGLKRRHIAVAK